MLQHLLNSGVLQQLQQLQESRQLLQQQHTTSSAGISQLHGRFHPLQQHATASVGGAQQRGGFNPLQQHATASVGGTQQRVFLVATLPPCSDIQEEECSPNFDLTNFESKFLSLFICFKMLNSLFY